MADVSKFIANPQPFSIFGSNTSTIAGFKNKDVPEQYIMTVISQRVGIVKAVSQDVFEMDVASEWKSLMGATIPSGGLVNTAEMIAQLFNKSLQHSVTSRRIWSKTDPMALSLNMVFVAENDPKTEVVMPCAMLQAMALPGENSEGFLTPPGPSPFINGSSLEFNKDQSDVISINIGTFLKFDNVIVKSARVVYDNMYSEEGYPMSAKATIVFETYEVITKAKLSKIYNMENQGSTGTNAPVKNIFDKIKGVINKF